ncbi:hypothetical protein [Streptomyces sp. NPDC049040]|uniref:hypothetical protein n=1 Tax=Streptomyces sp. NPDC049040 TaxID=3365593 RepID=UPI00372462C1
MFKSSARGAAVVALALAALTVSCSTTPKADTQASASGLPGSAPSSSAEPTISAEKVRDAFAGLQATLNDSCTPGNCAYFLGRVYDELQRMDRAMKADPKGPGHFSEPIDLIKKLDAEVDGGQSSAPLENHQTLLISTRDKINIWMQGHPDDYR